MAESTEHMMCAQLGSSDVAMRSDVGMVREANEDVAYIDSEGTFFVVSDGIGGHAAGEVASAVAVDVVSAKMRGARDVFASYATAPSPSGRETIHRLLEHAVRSANDAVVERAAALSEERGMGATIDVVVVLGNEAFGVHVGDSRVYHVRDSHAVLATLDHTVAQVMQRAGQISEQEAATSRMRSVLCNAIGSPNITVDHLYLRLETGDRLLMCTDGLYEYFDDDELGRRVSDQTPGAALDALIDDACTRGGRDNITGIIVEVDPQANTAAAMEVPVEAIDDDEPTVPISVPFDTRPSGPG